jgi:hypothetical protein
MHVYIDTEPKEFGTHYLKEADNFQLFFFQAFTKAVLQSQ